MEKTFVAIKPDAVKRGLIGEITKRFEQKGFKIVAMKMLQLDTELASRHYQEHIGKPFFQDLVDFITSGPIVGIVLQGENVVEQARHMMGITNPQAAAPGTIRGDFAQVTSSNVIHGSDCADSAKREIDLYFTENEIVS